MGRQNVKKVCVRGGGGGGGGAFGPNHATTKGM